MTNAERSVPLPAMAVQIILGLIWLIEAAALPFPFVSGMQATTSNVNTIAKISAERPMKYAPSDEMKPPTHAERA